MLKNKLRTINAKIAPKHIAFKPNWIVLGVNNVCNLHCKMCDVGTQNLETNFAQNLVGTRPLHMPLELFKKIADDTHRYFPKAKLGYAFTEPLVYKHLFDSLDYANSRNLFTSITTNGLTLKQKADELVSSNCHEVYISLDGLEEVHNEIRGNKKSFQKAIEGIKALANYPKMPQVSIFCVITEWNIGSLVEFAKYFKDLPIKEIGFLHTNYTTTDQANKHNQLYGNLYPATDSNLDEVNLTNFNLELLLEEINELKALETPYKITFSPNLTSLEDLKTFYMKPEIKWGKVCNDVFSNIMIKSDGSAIPSHGRCYNLNVGNIYEQSLNEIWNSETLGKFRKDLIKAGGLFPACTRCCSAF
jgi:MoaA/NifB/PqqE/SkfB family radical SAM enzyme